MPSPTFLGGLCPSGWRGTHSEPGKLSDCHPAAHVKVKSPTDSTKVDGPRVKTGVSVWEPSTPRPRYQPSVSTIQRGILQLSSQTRGFSQVISKQNVLGPNSQTPFIYSTTIQSLPSVQFCNQHESLMGNFQSKVKTLMDAVQGLSWSCSSMLRFPTTSFHPPCAPSLTNTPVSQTCQLLPASLP